MLCQLLVYGNVTQLHTHMHRLLYSFPLWFVTGYWAQFPVSHTKTLLFIHSKCNHLHQPTPDSQAIPLPWPPQVCSLSLPWFFFFFCHTTHAILVLWPGIKPEAPVLEGWVLLNPLDRQGSPCHELICEYSPLPCWTLVTVGLFFNLAKTVSF